MYSIGAFLGGKVMAIFPNEHVYYKELYQYAIDLSNETGIFIEIRYFDAVAYKEMMECSRNATSYSNERMADNLEEIKHLQKELLEEMISDELVEEKISGEIFEEKKEQ
jgi:hypothetical protein